MSVVELQILDKEIGFSDVHCARSTAEVKDQVLHVQRRPLKSKRMAMEKFSDERCLTNAGREDDSFDSGVVSGTSNAQVVCAHARSVPSGLCLRVVQFGQIDKFGKRVDLLRIDNP